jgi:septum formation inhibitor MinC
VRCPLCSPFHYFTHEIKSYITHFDRAHPELLVKGCCAKNFLLASIVNVVYSKNPNRVTNKVILEKADEKDKKMHSAKQFNLGCKMRKRRRVKKARDEKVKEAKSSKKKKAKSKGSNDEQKRAKRAKKKREQNSSSSTKV